MKKLIAILLCGCAAGARPKSVSLKTVPAAATLSYAGSSQQFLAIATDADGTERDVTGEVEWRISNAALAQVSDIGRVTAVADGSLTIRATLSGAHAESSVRVQGSQTARPFSFARDIGGILTKRGCNQAACHGGVKGRGGLKLSANALFPNDDYEWITKGGAYQVLTAEVQGERIPRVDVRNPAASLLLTKPTMATPHGGGKRLEADSDDYKAILAWVKNGAPYGAWGGTEPELMRLEVYPTMAAVPVEGRRRLLVTGRFGDGHTEDFTRQVLYASNNADVA